MVAVWAWEDEAAGRLRARVFPNGIGIAEDEATGAAALQFGALIGRDVVIRQGEGSELHVRPGARRDGRGRRARRAGLRAPLRTGGRGLTSSPADEPGRIRHRGRPVRRPRHAPAGARPGDPQAARRGRRAADRLARRLDLRRPGRRARAPADGLQVRAGGGVRGGGRLARGRARRVRRHRAGHADGRAHPRRRRPARRRAVLRHVRRRRGRHRPRGAGADAHARPAPSRR